MSKVTTLRSLVLLSNVVIAVTAWTTTAPSRSYSTIGTTHNGRRAQHPFAVTTTPFTRFSAMELCAKKKKVRNNDSKGFGKVEKEIAPTSSSSYSEDDADGGSSLLQSIEDVSPAGSSSSQAVVVEEIDESLPPEERAKKVLREKYGMKTLAEKNLNEKQLQARQEQLKFQEELKRKAALDQDVDIIAMLPPAAIQGIDFTLKFGVFVTSTLFLIAGGAICFEAWSTVSGNAMPENIDSFIADTVEPNFTTLLGILLAFSVSLGLFASAQLGSGAAVYKEDE